MKKNKLPNKIIKAFRLILDQLNIYEKKLANQGERLVPKSLNDPEVIRHKSSYQFFKKIIQNDLKQENNKQYEIIDLGCGVGYGCYTLSKIKCVKVVGVDMSIEAIKYCQKHYQAPNINYRQVDLNKFILKMPTFDYVVSRGVFEHLKNGLSLAKKTAWRRRLIFDVPYNETAGINPFHLITGITERNFVKYPNKELFYEDLKGIIYDQDTKPAKPNMIICVASSPKMKTIKESKIKFPQAPWRGKKLK